MPPQLPGSAAPGPGRPLATYASVAHVARVYDYLLGGKDNFAADREAAEQAMRINPDIVCTARANRGFLVRTTSYLTRQAGLRQFPRHRHRHADSVSDAAVRAQMWGAIGRKP
jgi:S-adenosyl methyltransferase